MIFANYGSSDLPVGSPLWQRGVRRDYLESVYKLPFFIFVMPEVCNPAFRTY